MWRWDIVWNVFLKDQIKVKPILYRHILCTRNRLAQNHAYLYFVFLKLVFKTMFVRLWFDIICFLLDKCVPYCYQSSCRWNTKLDQSKFPVSMQVELWNEIQTLSEIIFFCVYFTTGKKCKSLILMLPRHKKNIRCLARSSL